MSSNDTREPERTEDVAKVAVHVMGDDVDPKLVQQATGVVPTECWRKGDVIPPRRPRAEIRRHTGMYTIECRATSVEEAMREVLRVVEPIAATLRSEAESAGGTVFVTIWWDPAARQGGFLLPTDLLIRFASMGPKLRVYFPG